MAVFLSLNRPPEGCKFSTVAPVFVVMSIGVTSVGSGFGNLVTSEMEVDTWLEEASVGASAASVGGAGIRRIVRQPVHVYTIACP
jgi:hypothetical protein